MLGACFPAMSVVTIGDITPVYVCLLLFQQAFLFAGPCGECYCHETCDACQYALSYWSLGKLFFPFYCHFSHCCHILSFLGQYSVHNLLYIGGGGEIFMKNL